jgi:hypothetical protein
MSEIFKQVEIDALRINPEWQSLKGTENRMLRQFGGIGDDGRGEPEYMVIDNSFSQDEINQLVERKATFPMETAEGIKYKPIPINPAPEKVVFVPENQLIP